MKKPLLTLTTICALASTTLLPARSLAMPATSKPFGQTKAGEPITLYTLSNARGMSVSIMDYGATVVSLLVPDRQGKADDIVLGFDNAEKYFTQTVFLGATIGRYGNRIAKATFQLDGKTYHLAANNGVNSLHGGKEGFDKRMWKGTIAEGASPSVRFARTSPDGEEGYPGTMAVAVTYTLTDDDQLRISYEATTDRTTVVNLTHHSYFNLAGAGNGTILQHVLTVHAGSITPVDATLIPTGKLLPVEGTPWDFRLPKAIGADLKATGGDPIGYDHNFALNKGAANAAEVYEPTSGRVMTVTTDQPGMQFYTGNFLDGTIVGKGGKAYPQYGAFCLETQHFPDSPNQPAFPSTVLKPGEVFKSTTTYAFSAR